MRVTMPDTDPLFAAAQSAAGDRVQSVRVDNAGRANIVLDVTDLDPIARDDAERRLREAVGGHPGVAEVRILATAERRDRRILAVASGKGGVGKSTLSANLAVALARAGTRVGVVDADIYGPSQPRLMQAEGVRPHAHDKRLVPIPTPHGVPLLSMGQLVEPDRAIAWRGPMAAGALGQLVDAAWGPIDTLVVDMPPGTGDVQLTMVQKHRPAGALIVSTPQDLALIDARRAMDLFEKAGVPIIGLVENMAGYLCPHCGRESDPFGHGGVEAAAAAAGLPFLGRLPLDRRVLDAAEAGRPVAAGDGPEAAPYHRLAAAVSQWLNRGPASRV
ncbi:ATP-binding protein involved in chromosome partitioning [Sphingomonas jejuensis]|uniref:Iron-sulfur cluster carrier protein n=1 Tax=Sphingomonas jejuensis TaxID=904715 RepID=A0ABX0XIZ1_9SPHN|nr:Mrp/NBP35 family ATP-binding protein [Sphingomonas jejuensis]NJC32777.1 ATP-binding protein involved in chromosome partitioning [Sphingomonas jejuensis]